MCSLQRQKLLLLPVQLPSHTHFIRSKYSLIHSLQKVGHVYNMHLMLKSWIWEKNNIISTFRCLSILLINWYIKLSVYVLEGIHVFNFTIMKIATIFVSFSVSSYVRCIRYAYLLFYKIVNISILQHLEGRVCAILQLCLTPGDPMSIAWQVSLPMSFPSPEYWSIASPGGFTWPRDRTCVSYDFLHWQVGYLPPAPLGKTPLNNISKALPLTKCLILSEIQIGPFLNS